MGNVERGGRVSFQPNELDPENLLPARQRCSGGPYLVSQTAFTEAILEIGTRDKALATVLLHQHECIEAAKREAAHAKEAADEAKSTFAGFMTRFDGWTAFAGTTLIAICGTLIVCICAVAWAVMTHPHGFAL
jgi:hypothetical protein